MTKRRMVDTVHETTVLLRHLPGWLLYQTALTRTTPEGRPASITYSTPVTEEKAAMNTVDVLRGAKEILSDEGRWCRRGNYAMNRQGHSCATNASAAHEFCGLGAIAHVAGLDAMCGIDTAYNTPAAEALLAAAPVQSAFIHWNDRVATHEELIDAFDRAILSLAPAPQLEPVAA